MNKIYFLLIIVLITFLIIFSQLPSKKEVVDTSMKKKEYNKIENNFSTQTSKNTHLVKNESLTVKKFNVNDNYQLIVECGFSLDTFLHKFEYIDLESLKLKEKQKIEETLYKCDKWFNDLGKMSVLDREKLKINTEKKKEQIKKLGVFKYDKNTLIEARNNIYNSDNYIKLLSLSYLLRYDFSFQKEIASSMGIAEIGYLVSGGNIYLETLYVCQHGADCTALSPMMQDICNRDENSCGMSFPIWLRSGQISLNLYDDMMRAIIAIDKVLDSDWFLEHPLGI